MDDKINHPKHYNSSDTYCTCGRQIECIDVVRKMDYALGNVIKYVWRHKYKNGIEDLRKAQWYLNDFINSKETELGK